MSDYKRLTTKDKDGNWQVWEDDFSHPFEALQTAIDKLAELEDKIENGTLIELPCKVRDTVYWLYTTNIEQKIYECYVTDFIYNNKGLDICLSKKRLKGYVFVIPKDIGNTWFLTKDEAEKKLQELKYENNCKI